MRFLEEVDASIALIGVGENNKFGHPNESVLERFKQSGTLIYRTDEMGEIMIFINKNMKYRINF